MQVPEQSTGRLVSVQAASTVNPEMQLKHLPACCWHGSLAKSDAVQQLVDYIIVEPPIDAGDELQYKCAPHIRSLMPACCQPALACCQPGSQPGSLAVLQPPAASLAAWCQPPACH